MTKALITVGAGSSVPIWRAAARPRDEVLVIDNSARSARQPGDFRRRPGFQFVKGGHPRRPRCNCCLAVRRGVSSGAAVGCKLIADAPSTRSRRTSPGREMSWRPRTVRPQDPPRFQQRGLRQEREDPLRRGRRLVLGGNAFSRWAYACSKAIDNSWARPFTSITAWGSSARGSSYDRSPADRAVRHCRPHGSCSGPSRTAHSDLRLRRADACFCYVEGLVDAVIALMGCEQAPGRFSHRSPRRSAWRAWRPGHRNHR
jgi:hypothetical protein